MARFRVKLPGRLNNARGDLAPVLNALTDAIAELREHIGEDPDEQPAEDTKPAAKSSRAK